MEETSQLGLRQRTRKQQHDLSQQPLFTLIYLSYILTLNISHISLFLTLSHTLYQVLCTVKIFQGGSQQVTPGFSEEECESDEEGGPYRTIRSCRIAKTKGHRLTTFSLIGFKNFRYSLENLNSETLGSVEEVSVCYA